MVASIITGATRAAQPLREVPEAPGVRPIRIRPQVDVWGSYPAHAPARRWAGLRISGCRRSDRVASRRALNRVRARAGASGRGDRRLALAERSLEQVARRLQALLAMAGQRHDAD